jgi:putative hydrolase of the HAD superfamily
MIKFVYFDIGGVIVRDFSGTNKWQDLLDELGISFEASNEFTEFFDKLEPEVCTGRDLETLIPLVKEKFGLQVADKNSLLIDGFVNRFELNESIWHSVEYASKNYKVGLLTNMYPGMLDALKERGLTPNISWDAIVDSSVEGVKKPDFGIYKLAEEKAHASGNEILFIDNSKSNIDAAKEFGWNTFLYDSSYIEKSSDELLNFLTSQKKDITAL